MTLTVLEPEGLYPDTSLEQRIMGPSVRILQGACKTSLAELPDAICQQVEGLMTLRMAVPADQIARFPKLKVIVAPTTVGIAAAARYISTSDAKGKVMVTGLGTPNQMREYVEDGTVEAFALWNPADLGYLAAFAAQALVNGDITGAEGDEFEAGKLGSYTVGADASVLLGDPYVFNADNIADFDF